MKTTACGVKTTACGVGYAGYTLTTHSYNPSGTRRGPTDSYAGVITVSDLKKCAKCGQLHERCSAHVKGSDPLQPCRRYPKGSAPTCRAHGGGAKQVREAAEKRDAGARAEKALNRLGLRREGLTATELLTEVVERAGADLDYLATLAAQGDPDAAAAYGEWLDRAARYSKAGVDAGIAERTVRVQEATAAALITVVREALTKANINTDQQTVVLGELASGLRALETGTV